MEHPAISQQLKMLFLCGAGLLLAIYVGWNLGSANYVPLILGTVVIVIAAIGLFLGSSVWGGRNYVNVYVGLAAFFVVQSIPMQPKVWARLPYMVLAVTTFDLIIAIITTIFPSSIYKIYPFYSAVSVAGIEEIL